MQRKNSRAECAGISTYGCCDHIFVTGGCAVTPAFTVLVVGSRTYDDAAAVRKALDTLLKRHPGLTVLTGDDTETEKHAWVWASDNGRPCIADPRGPEFLVCYLPDGCVAFGGGDTEAAERAGLRVWRPA